jgi:hypothetical protein
VEARIMDKKDSRNEFEKEGLQAAPGCRVEKPKERLTISGGVQDIRKTGRASLHYSKKEQ